MFKRVMTLTALTVFLLGAQPVVAEENSPKNIVIGINRADNHTFVRSATSIKTVYDQESVSPENLAYSRSWYCTGCKTVTVAVQAVITTAAATNVSPHNAAVAINASCSSCQTFAAAYQYVATAPTAAELSPSAKEEIRRLSREIDAVANSNLSFPEMDARLDSLVAQLWLVIDQDLGIQGNRLQAEETE